MRQPLSAEPVGKLQASALIRPGTVTGGSSRSGITAEGVPSAILTAQACSSAAVAPAALFSSPMWQPRRFAPRACRRFKERPARPFGDWHRLFAPLKTPGIKAGTVHRRYRRLMPLPVPGAAPLHPVTPTLRLLAPAGCRLCHARCPLRGWGQAPGHPSLLTVRFPDPQGDGLAITVLSAIRRF